MRNRLALTARGLLALLALLALTVGVPAALTAGVGWPLPTAIPTLDAVLAVVRYGQIADTTLIKILAVLVWVAWAQLTLAVLVELVAAARGRVARRVLGAAALQPVAARLVSTVVLVFSSFTARPSLALDHLPALMPSPAAAAFEPAGSPPPPITADPALAAVASAPAVHTVQRGDTLWDLAERMLGDGHRWTEIRDLNLGRPQPNGGALTATDDHIRRGWTLLLPADARPPNPPLGQAENSFVVVAPGDTLSGIAQRVYGDADQYPVLLDANAGRPQPDGRTLTDPDVIHPGWQLHLPADPVEPTAPPPAPTYEPSAAPPTAEPPQAPAIGDRHQRAATERDLLPPDEQEQTGPVTSGQLDDAKANPSGPAAADPMTDTQPADQDADVSAPAIVTASALLAAGLLWTLRRLRRRQLRRRRPGRDLPVPGPALQQAERQLRAAAAGQPLEWLDATLRLLTVRLRDQARQLAPVRESAPAVLCVRAGHLGVEVLLTRPDQTPPDGFNVADGGYTWQLDHVLSLAAVQAAAGDAPPLAPATVTVGDTPEGPLLINLEHVAVLAVEGPAAQADAFLSSIALELTTAPWAASVAVRPVTTGDDPLRGLPGVSPTDDLPALTAELTALAKANQAAVGDAETTLSARVAVDGEDWPAAVVVVRASESTDRPALDALCRAAHTAGSGLAVVAAGAVSSTSWRLLLSDDGTATLEPLGLRVTAAGVDADTVAAAAGLLDLAAGDDITRPTPLLPAEPSDTRGGDDDAEPAAPVHLDPLPVEVSVLGPVTVTGWATDDVRARSAEIVAYLAVADRPVPTDKLRTALWPNGVNYNTFKTALSRTRRSLGVDAAGTFHLPEAKDGRYRVGPGVGCDWTRFQALTAAARTARPGAAAPLLRTALALVTGPPFDGVTANTYSWAFDEQIVSAIEVAVVDAAHRLAELAIDTGDTDLAVWAVAQGHLVTPGHEGLFRARMRAHAAAGDLDAVHQAFREAQRAAQALDPLDDVQPETQQLHQQLTARRRTARGA